jgi:hypothetical protein
MDELLKNKIVRAMTWMLADIDNRNEDLDKVEDSPEMAEARESLETLKRYG